MPVYNTFKKKKLDGDINFLGDSIRVALVTSSYTPDIDTHEFWSQVNANESSATGYSAGGTTLASKTTVINPSNDSAVFDAGDTSWSVTGTITARYAILYKDTGSASTSALIAYIDFGEDKSASDGDFTIQWNNSGIFELT